MRHTAWSRRSLVARALAFGAAILCACSSKGSGNGATAMDSTSEALPCDVSAVLTANCTRCHSDPPKYGAPMPLVTLADLDAPAVSMPSEKVWQRVEARIHDPVSPMPQGTTMPAADIATLDTWINAGAPSSTVTCGGADGGADASAQVGPQYLPCPVSEQSTFRAHGATPTNAFEVPANADNLYQCFTFASPWTDGMQATSFAPIIGDSRVVHHFILYETTTPQVDGAMGECKMPSDAAFVDGWAPGGGNRALPSNVGLELPGAGHWLILQVHYWNVAGYTNAQDQSGVAMCTTNVAREHTAVVSTLGSADILLPPHSTGVQATGMCTPSSTEPLHIIGATPHMHTRGTTFRTEILKGGDTAQRTTLVNVPQWDFQTQNTYDSEAIINPGDKLLTTCTYDNASDGTVSFGERTEDEMCFDFVTVWPAPGLATAGGAASRHCIDQ